MGSAVQSMCCISGKCSSQLNHWFIKVCEVCHALMYLHDQAHGPGGGGNDFYSCCRHVRGAQGPAILHGDLSAKNIMMRANRLGGRCPQVPLEGCLDFQTELLYIYLQQSESEARLRGELSGYVFIQRSACC